MRIQIYSPDPKFEIGEMVTEIYNVIDGDELRQLSESTKDRLFEKMQDALIERLIQ